MVFCVRVRVPVAPTAIARSFELGRELPEARVKALLELARRE